MKTAAIETSGKSPTKCSLFQKRCFQSWTYCLGCHLIKSCPQKVGNGRQWYYWCCGLPLLNSSYIIWILLAGSAVAAAGACKIACDTVFIVLNPEVWEPIRQCPAEGVIKPQGSAGVHGGHACCTDMSPAHLCLETILLAAKIVATTATSTMTPAPAHTRISTSFSRLKWHTVTLNIPKNTGSARGAKWLK